jgi:aminoglycoside phosphotransferase (APT) family kinase protein
MPPAEVDLSVDQVRRLLATQVPELADAEITPLAHGWDNFLFRLDDEWLGRFPRREVAVELLHNEIRWLPVLASRLSFPVPIPELVGEPGEGYPWPWTITSWIPGVPLADSPVFDQRRGSGDLGRFLRGLHLPAPAEAPPNPYRGVPLSDRDQAIRDRLAQVGAVVESDTALACWEDALGAAEHAGAPVWLHGDLHPGNVIVEGGRISGVVDFGDITAGDPATDLSSAWTLLGGEHRHRFQEAYGEIDEATWRRARGWALSLGLAHLAGSADNPMMGVIGKRTLRAVLGDWPGR